MREVIKTDNGYILRISGEEIETQSEGFAAWYTRVHLDNGDYPYVPVTIDGKPCTEGMKPYYMKVTIPGTIVESYHPSGFGGVLYPSESQRERDRADIGKKTTVTHFPYAYGFE